MLRHKTFSGVDTTPEDLDLYFYYHVTTNTAKKNCQKDVKKSVRSAGRVAENHFLSKPFQRFCMLFWQIDFKRNPSKPPFFNDSQNSHESETFTNAGPLF
jgi:hypothetical protein